MSEAMSDMPEKIYQWPYPDAIGDRGSTSITKKDGDEIEYLRSDTAIPVEDVKALVEVIEKAKQAISDANRFKAMPNVKIATMDAYNYIHKALSTFKQKYGDL
jgi:hypothetical protein